MIMTMAGGVGGGTRNLEHIYIYVYIYIYDIVLFEIRDLIWVVVSNIFYFHPYLGKIPNLTNIFQMG